MKRFRWMIMITAAAGISLACSLITGRPATPTASETTPTRSPVADTPTEIPATRTPTNLPATDTPEPTATQIPPLTSEILRNATYHLPQLGQTVTLSDGEYQGGTEVDPVYAWLYDPVLVGDLDGDGAQDAAVLLAENSGGSGVFVSVVVMLNHNGQPLQSHAAFVDDRPLINDFSLSDERIELSADLHGPDDPMCCPTYPVTEEWRWTPNRLVLTRFTSETPAGDIRAINISTPVPGSEVSGSVHMAGSVTIAPFENTLACRVYDPAGNLLAKSPIMVDAEDLGAPGTFDAVVDLTGIPTGADIHLELVDVSMRDGSMLAMDSVELRVIGE